MPEDPATPGTDPFKDRTYRERRALLGFSAASIAITYLGLVPDSIPTLGLQQLTEAQRSGLVTMLFWLVTYFLVAFLVYAVADFVKWRADVREAKILLAADKAALSDVDALLKQDPEDPGLKRSVGRSANAIDQAQVQLEIEKKKFETWLAIIPISAFSKYPAEVDQKDDKIKTP